MGPLLLFVDEKRILVPNARFFVRNGILAVALLRRDANGGSCFEPSLRVSRPCPHDFEIHRINKLYSSVESNESADANPLKRVYLLASS
jgi:hypothetical protein